jgi:hypothetical protein
MDAAATDEEVRMFSKAQLSSAMTRAVERALKQQAQTYERKICSLDTTIARLKAALLSLQLVNEVDKKGAVQVWLRVRPALNTAVLSSRSFRRTDVDVGSEKFNIHHIFGPWDANNRPCGVLAGQALITEVWDKWVELVRAATGEITGFGAPAMGRRSLLLCLGETGSGKTETIIGRPSQKEDVKDETCRHAWVGLLPRTINALLDADEFGMSAVDVLAIEVYNNKMKNLVGHKVEAGESYQGAELALTGTDGSWYYKSGSPNQLKNKPKHWRLQSKEDVEKWLCLVKKNRQQADTTAKNPLGNKTSSRSHLMLHIQAKRDNGLTDDGDIWMLDLAGNEDHDPGSGHAHETTNINASVDELFSFLGKMHAITSMSRLAQKKAWEELHIEFKNNQHMLVRSLRAVVVVPPARRPRVVVLGMAPDEEQHRDRTLKTLRKLNDLTLLPSQKY